MMLEIVTPDRRVVVGKTTDVIIPGKLGEFEVLPGHEEILALLGNGILSFKTGTGETVKLHVQGGFVDVDRDRVTIMAERAALQGEVVEEHEKKQLHAAEQKLRDLGPVAESDEAFLIAKAEVDSAAAKLTLLR